MNLSIFLFTVDSRYFIFITSIFTGIQDDAPFLFLVLVFDDIDVTIFRVNKYKLEPKNSGIRRRH